MKALNSVSLCSTYLKPLLGVPTTKAFASEVAAATAVFHLVVSLLRERFPPKLENDLYWTSHKSNYVSATHHLKDSSGEWTSSEIVAREPSLMTHSSPAAFDGRNLLSPSDRSLAVGNQHHHRSHESHGARILESLTSHSLITPDDATDWQDTCYCCCLTPKRADRPTDRPANCINTAQLYACIPLLPRAEGRG